MLWPESDSPTLRNSLSAALSSLRNQFEPPGVPQGTVIRADRFSVGLNPATITTDVMEFELAIKAAAKADSAVERAQHLTSAVELYQGLLLPGLYEDWIRLEQDRLTGLFFDSVGALVAQFESVGDLRTALTHARHAVSVDPVREEGQHLLVRLLYADRQQASALRQYREYERLLEEETGEKPSAVLRSLAHRIESGSGLPAQTADSALSRTRKRKAVAPPASSDGHDTVTFLLTDIEGSTRLFQEVPEAYSAARLRHHELLRPLILSHGGWVTQESGDGFVIAFNSAGSALKCAVAAQQALSEEVWPEEVRPLKVRMAVHTGDMVQTGKKYEGVALHHASRMLTAAHGGQIVASEISASLAFGLGDEGIRLVDLGVWRLRDVLEPRRLFQVEYSGMIQAEFGPLAADPGHAASVPPRFTRFFGRGEEMTILREMLLSDSARLVTVTGNGGNGKSRLSLEVAEQLADAFAGAVYFVALQDLTDPALIPGAILDSLGEARSPRQEPLEQAVEALFRKPTLLALDNFEHLVEGGAELVQALLLRVPSLKLIVTSRKVLGLTTEIEFELSPLPVPGKEQTPEELSLYDSVQLFIDRAQQVMPHFQVNNSNAATLAALVGGLEGIPLAIELAAARAQVFTPAQMLSQLAHRFDFLASRKRDVTERQRTLRGALDWSYQLLTPELQRFFSRLSVFRGGWTVEAAERVCEEPLAIDYVEQLRECSLVLPGEIEGESLRFRMLETLREYGQESLTRDRELAASRQRHLRYYIALAEEAEQGMIRAEQQMWFKRLEAEHDNLTAALMWSTTDGADPISCLRLSGALFRFFLVRSWFREGRDWYAKCLAVADAYQRDAEDRAENTAVRPDVTFLNSLRAEVHKATGNLAIQQGEYSEARDHLSRSLNLYLQHGDQAGTADSLQSLGLLSSHQSDYPAAQERYEESLKIRRQQGDRRGVAQVLNNLGVVAKEQADYSTARARFEEALTVFKEVGDTVFVTYALNNLGVVAEHVGDYERARALHEECLGIRREIGDRSNIALSLNNLGMVAQHQGDLRKAHRCMSEGLAIREEIGDSGGVATSLYSLAVVAKANGDLDEARRLFGRSLAPFVALDNRSGVAFCLEGLAYVEDEGRAERAALLLGAAKRIREEIESPLSPDNLEVNGRTLSLLRQRLGDDAFERAMKAGQALEWRAAADFALE